MSDLISRREVLRCIKESKDNIDWGQSEDGDAFLHYTGALYRTIASEKCFPSARPEARGYGKWISEWINDFEGKHVIYPYRCTNCNKYSRAMYDYCPNCGADMRGGGMTKEEIIAILSLMLGDITVGDTQKKAIREAIKIIESISTTRG